MNGDVEKLRPLELLTRQAETLGAVIVLTTDRDSRRAGRRLVTREPGAKLTRLIVVVPKRIQALPRWDQLHQGTVLCAATIPDFVTVDEIAVLMVEELQQLRENAA